MSQSDLAISVRGLSKSYTISHQSTGLRGRRPTFRDTITNFARDPFRKSPKETFWALKDVSFDVKKGDVVGIIGRNGAGKSTLLKILSRITKPTTGEIDVFGRIGSLLEVGTGFHSELSGRENIFLNGAILGMTRPEIRKQFDAIVDFAGVEQFLDTPVKRYSSGMYVRLAFAVAAHLRSEILIVDEVLAVGDVEFQRKCLGKMSEVAMGGRTVLFVSHNMSAVQNLCQKSILLSYGSVMRIGASGEIIRAYTQLGGYKPRSDLSAASRSGQGMVRFKRIWFETSDDSENAAIVAGEPLTIASEYASMTSAPLMSCRVSVMFSDPLGNALFNCSSELTNPELESLPHRGVVRCRLPRLPLSNNQYVVSLFFMANGEIQDFVESATVCVPEDGDFYGTGRLYPEGWRGKGVLVPYDWSVAASDGPRSLVACSANA